MLHLWSYQLIQMINRELYKTSLCGILKSEKKQSITIFPCRFREIDSVSLNINKGGDFWKKNRWKGGMSSSGNGNISLKIVDC